jgi:hypothetical protein
MQHDVLEGRNAKILGHLIATRDLPAGTCRTLPATGIRRGQLWPPPWGKAQLTALAQALHVGADWRALARMT